MDKKAQAQIITVVLIILLVLAAIIVVWQVIKATVKESAAEVAGGTGCVTMDVEIVEAKAGAAGAATLKLKREVGKGSLAGVKVYVNDAFLEDLDFITLGQELDELETDTYILVNALTATTDLVKIAKVVGANFANGKICAYMGESANNGVIVIP